MKVRLILEGSPDDVTLVTTFALESGVLAELVREEQTFEDLGIRRRRSARPGRTREAPASLSARQEKAKSYAPGTKVMFITERADRSHLPKIGTTGNVVSAKPRGSGVIVVVQTGDGKKYEVPSSMLEVAR